MEESNFVWSRSLHAPTHKFMKTILGQSCINSHTCSKLAWNKGSEWSPHEGLAWKATKIFTSLNLWMHILMFCNQLCVCPEIDYSEKNKFVFMSHQFTWISTTINNLNCIPIGLNVSTINPLKFGSRTPFFAITLLIFATWHTKH